jgi:Holliday junction resolvasome RuvABC endonuclease subunit
MLIGVDPGAGGAIALIDETGRIVAIADMPTVEVRGRRRVDPVALAALLREWAPRAAIVEEVHSQPNDGHVGAFAFGKATGVALGVLATLGVSVTEVPPQEWKRAMRVPSADTSAKRKEASRARASQLLPAAAPKWWPLKKHNGRAEAALIGLFGLRSSGTVPVPIEW